jgi:hypothetical protein
VLQTPSGPSYASLFALSFDAIRRNAAGNPEVLSRLARRTARLAAATPIAARRDLAILHTRATMRFAEETLSIGPERQALVADAEQELALAAARGVARTDSTSHAGTRRTK